MDNLLDDLGGDVIIPGGAMTRESKKKSLSTKNLSLNTAAAAGSTQDDNLKIISDNFEKSKSKGKKRKKIIDDDDFKALNGDNSQNPTTLEGMVDTSQKPQSNNLEKTIMSLLHDDQKPNDQEQQAI